MCPGLSINRGVSDLLKIISAVLVMFSHYYNLKAQAGYALNPIELVLRSQGGNVGVAIFFFLSGYGLMMSELKRHLNFKEFLKKRFLKVYLPVLLVTMIWIPIYYSITPPHCNSVIFADLLYKFGDPVLWFIRVLVLMYVGFYVFTLILTKNKLAAIGLLWISTAIVCIISYYSNGSFGLNSLSGIPLFSIGVILALFSSRYIKGMHVALFPLVLSFLCVSITMYFHDRFFENLMHVIADYSVVGAIIVTLSRWNIAIKVPSLLALITFDIYLVHFKVLTFMQSITPELPILMFLMVTLFISISFYMIRTKLIRFN